LLNISQPFVDAWSWRQADVAMIAENFYRHGFNIFYPQINWAGNSPGYVGTEFPVVPFIASLLYVFFGVHDWIGRSVSLFFFALSVPFLYVLVKRVSNESGALFAVAIYNIVPLSIFTSRSFMPDMTSLSFSIIALYLFAEWLKRPHIKSRLFIAVTTATSLAILVKLPAIIIGLPLIYMAWRQYSAKILLTRELWGFAALSLMFPLAWYYHAYLISASYYPHHMFGSGGVGIDSLAGYRRILHEAATFSLTPLLSAGMLIGIFLPPKTKFGRVFHWWLLAIFLFAFSAPRGHWHPWYLLPIAAIAAAFAGLACDLIWSRVARQSDSKIISVSLLFVFLSFASYLSYVYVSPLYEPWGMPSFHAGNELNRIVPSQALVIVADGGDPTCLYYSRRKGWHFLENFGKSPTNSHEAIMELERLRAQGADYLTFVRHTLWWFDYYQQFKEYLDSHYRRISMTQDYVIFDLTPVSGTQSVREVFDKSRYRPNF
jgi:4-amino-4-deoxy-L-arabinose transferase-like glycosyltransferase